MLTTVKEEEMTHKIGKNTVSRERQNEIHKDIKAKSLQHMLGIAASKDIDSLFRKKNLLGKVQKTRKSPKPE